MSYHIINTGNPNHLHRRKRYGPKHPLGLQALMDLWPGVVPQGRERMPRYVRRKKRVIRRMQRKSRKKNLG